jgi:hypothetical protein
MHNHSHTFDWLASSGLLAVAGVFSETLAPFAMLAGVIYGGLNVWLRWRDSEAGRKRHERECFRRWERARDREL